MAVIFRTGMTLGEVKDRWSKIAAGGSYDQYILWSYFNDEPAGPARDYLTERFKESALMNATKVYKRLVEQKIPTTVISIGTGHHPTLLPTDNFMPTFLDMLSRADGYKWGVSSIYNVLTCLMCSNRSYAITFAGKEPAVGGISYQPKVRVLLPAIDYKKLKMMTPEFRHISGICQHCLDTCGDCDRRVDTVSTYAMIYSLRTTGACDVCNSQSLKEYTPPPLTIEHARRIKARMGSF